MRSVVFILILLGMFGGASRPLSVLADENADINMVKRFHSLVNKMKYERERIDFGVARGKGERTLTREIDGKTIIAAGPVEYFIAFDFVAGKQRVDRSELNFRDDGSYTRHLGQHIETNDAIEYCSYPLDYPMLGIVFVARPKGAGFDFHNKDFCHPLDIRSFGMLDLQHFTHGNSISFENQIDGFRQRVPEVFDEDENGIVRFEFHKRVEEQGELHRLVFWIDTKNGFTCQRYMNIRELDSRKDQPWILDEVRVSWKKIEGVWVPGEIALERSFPIEVQETLVMAFDWESVNRPVDKKYFRFTDFATSEHAHVVSVSLKPAEPQER